LTIQQTLLTIIIIELSEEDALREAVVNAVCHRNYFEKGARIMVEIFDDRVDIVSPGGLCKGITPENFGTVTITRNSTIASMFFRIDYIEQMGTGIRRMRNATRKADVAEPEFEFTGFFKVTFKRNELDMTSAINIFLRQAIRKNGIPFELIADVPQKKTRQFGRLKGKMWEADCHDWFEPLEDFKEYM
jgi:predicted HTH transcriptional regulator